ncbi:terpenoid cyclases/protein prenyltransferase alpha-alpha toroid [Echria macrotheca]|uniref:Terpenoid cyclases/protein prenyltransferase alpha-alpha toroid n=1 Tax=Echria macrotheca TaxID=438768 RepID=A0AAJ0B7Y9_9PEZI|nr:terpenoid cyclases/protein prenyltransferase alpha-alpha toroid [Echria macrotheca]
MADEARPTVLDVERQLKYWKMCLRSPLPEVYQSNEANRLALAYFIINSITILTPPTADRHTLEPIISPAERKQLRQWVLSHQHPGGGFSGSTSLVFPLATYDEWDFEAGSRALEHSGLANIAATVFALQLLALLADDGNPGVAFRGVDRVRTLRWLRRLQRDDGSFGEVLRYLPTRGWFIAGGYDMRYCYVATLIRWMLRGNVKEGEPGWVEDFDTERLAQYILRSQTYDGGFAGRASVEPHAGYAYCAISALSLLDRPIENSISSHPSNILHTGIRDKSTLTHWLASRQFVYLQPSSGDSDVDEEDEVNFTLPNSLADLSLDDNLRYVGFNGRCNKVADTCYCWWVGAALYTLDEAELISWEPSRRFLLEKMQHRIGGFGKHPGSPPDLYHACFGLAILAVMGEKGLQPLDSSLAVPIETVRTIEAARRQLLDAEKEDSKTNVLARSALQMGLNLAGKKPAWLTDVSV